MTTTTLSSIYNYTANVIAYDANTKIATLDSPVNISLGYNDFIGGINSTYSISGQLASIAQAVKSGNTLSQLSSDESGTFVGIFNVPPNTFQTGQRIFRVDNRTVPTDSTTATTFAEATFTASGLSTKSQALEFSPSIDSGATTFTQVNQVSSQLISTITTYTPYDPIAQTFIISKDNFPNGTFIRSVKLFFASKPATNTPVKISIVGTLNGYPNGQVLDYSTVVLNANQVNVSATPHYLDSTTYTEFVFDAPVYIRPGVLYAIMVNANSPDYTCYFAQQNQFAVLSTAKAQPTDPNPTAPTKIGAAPYVGALFESQNSITWTADQTKDLMFVIDRCVFNTSVSPVIPFVTPKGLPYRKLGTDEINYNMDANTVSNLSGNYGTTSLVDAINVSTTDFVPSSTTVDYNYSATLAATGQSSGQSNITPGKYGTPTPENVYLNDGQGERFLNPNISGSFSLYATLTSSDPNLSPIISDDGVTLFNIQYIINNMGIGNNVISLNNGGAGYNVNTTTVTVSAPDVGSDQAILGFTANNGVISSVYTVYPGSGYLSTPTVSIVDANTSPGTGANISVHGETSPSGGNGLAKYFTKKVVLTPGNDSGDLRVYFTAYKPLGSNIYVYYKILNRTDTQAFEYGNWQLMTTISNATSYSASRTDHIEFECAPGINGNANNSLSYVSTNGQTYTSFSQFAIKVVMATNDNTSVPFLTDIRAIALPPGTGI